MKKNGLDAPAIPLFANPTYDWRRLWIAPNDTSGVAVRGLFSANIHAMSPAEDRPAARTLAEMAHVRALLLRGEARAGKTIAMTQEARRLIDAGDKVFWIDASDGVRDAPALLGEYGAQRGLTIFIDGLDVGLIRDRALDIALRSALQNLPPRSGARLRMALRTGYAALPLWTCLSETFGDRFEHLTLAPLRPEDVRTAALAERIDPDDFLTEIEGLRVAPLAARPLTLRLLVDRWRSNGRLPGRRQDLYEQGSEILLRENSDMRLNAGGGDDPAFAGRLMPPERFAISMRIAAFMTFCDRDHLELGADVRPSGLHVDAIATDGRSFTTRADVREVVGSSMFRPAGPNSFTFVHPSFMSFLAAKFVTTSAIAPSQAILLLCAPDGMIGANRIEVASWLGALEPSYFEHFVDKDPQVLLRSGIPAEEPEQRLRLARSLLDRSAQGELDLKELEQTGDLVLCAAPGLERALADVLSDKTEPLLKRLFAARMAKDAGEVPVSECAAVALDESEAKDLRYAAFVALRGRVLDARDVILALTVSRTVFDDLRVAALTFAMRDLLSPGDVIRRLRPSGSDFQQMLCMRLTTLVDVAALPDALSAILEVAAKPDFAGNYSQHLMVAQELANDALHQLVDPGVHAALVAFIATLPAREPWLRWSDPLDKNGPPQSLTEERRRALVSAVVSHSPSSANAARNLLEGCFLLHNEDLSWIVGKTHSALGGVEGPVWSTLAEQVARSCGGPPYLHLLSDGLTLEEVDEIARQSLPLPGDFERWTRPSRWDPDQTEEDEIDSETDDASVKVESIFKALDDSRLQRLQILAGGRTHAPSTTPSILLELADDSSRRLVRNDGELLSVVSESLERLQDRLKGRDPLVRALWNEGDRTSPKDENFFSDFIADHLRRDLGKKGLVADREVQIRTRLEGKPGERPDIRVQALAADIPDAKRPVASLTIEVKGCWHPELYSAMQEQLTDRYLRTTKDNFGLYLVGWFVCSAWSVPRIANRAPTSSDTIDEMRATLSSQALALSTPPRRITTVVIDASLG